MRGLSDVTISARGAGVCQLLRVRCLSASPMTVDSGTFKARAMAWQTKSVGFRCPDSIILIAERLNPVRSANCRCERPFASRYRFRRAATR